MSLKIYFKLTTYFRRPEEPVRHFTIRANLNRQQAITNGVFIG